MSDIDDLFTRVRLAMDNNTAMPTIVGGSAGAFIGAMLLGPLGLLVGPASGVLMKMVASEEVKLYDFDKIETRRSREHLFNNVARQMHFEKWQDLIDIEPSRLVPYVIEALKDRQQTMAWSANTILRQDL